MSHENVEIVRSIYAPWARGDFSSAEWAHPEVEFTIVDLPAPVSRTGVAGMAEAYRGWLSAWEEFRVDPEECRELDDERVLVMSHFSGRGKTSGGGGRTDGDKGSGTVPRPRGQGDETCHLG